jgi:hypothetical protein
LQWSQQQGQHDQDKPEKNFTDFKKSHTTAFGKKRQQCAGDFFKIFLGAYIIKLTVDFAVWGFVKVAANHDQVVADYGPFLDVYLRTKADDVSADFATQLQLPANQENRIFYLASDVQGRLEGVDAANMNSARGHQDIFISFRRQQQSAAYQNKKKN